MWSYICRNSTNCNPASNSRTACCVSLKNPFQAPFVCQMTLRCWGGFLRLKKLKEAWGSGNPWQSKSFMKLINNSTKQITAFGIGLWRWTSQGSYLNIFSSLGPSYLTTERQSEAAAILEATCSVFSTCYFSRVQRAAKASTWFRHLRCQAEDWLRKSVEVRNKLSQAILDILNIHPQVSPDVLQDAGFHSRHF